MTNQSHTKPQRDQLLAAGKILTVLLQAVTAIVSIGLTILIPVILFNSDQVASSLADSGSTASVATILTLIVVFLAAVIVVVATAFHFFQLLGRIIDTVRDGEPFVEINADRLSRMGWIVLLFQVASFPIGAVASYLAAQMPDHVDVSADIEFSLTGILMAIVLFILARVFRHGIKMREDLEGTV
ncbi:DUF2975 domain-containing protein [Pontixanthobacter sp. CEM42]|uniref:DUF2975 domain-containing protein n=1 Tax=Pontixanthobacter sp. CEM42 TaxID=2792077 RepID=UPI001ADF0242|nr:DUF2975 domain-containing protein [Pontixanthobacter sp. CEM42]